MKVHVCVTKLYLRYICCYLQGYAAKGDTKEGLVYMRKAQKLEPDTKVGVIK
jgi:hypothetical protein